jgi:hypothetical protein
VGIPKAILDKRLLRFVYDGYFRTVEPHTYGIDKQGRHTLVAYQVRGGSRSGELAGWKTFHESEMHRLSTLDERFSGPRPEYRRGDGAFVSIIAEL